MPIFLVVMEAFHRKPTIRPLISIRGLIEKGRRITYNPFEAVLGKIESGCVMLGHGTPDIGLR
ncbi:MAG: hypothetical protein V6Z81_04700 [Parvularculales bacterium]